MNARKSSEITQSPQVFNFNGSDLRVVTNDSGKLFFVGKEVAQLLGYKDYTNAIKQHCKSVVKRHLPHPQSPSKTIEVITIPERDVYRLVMRSKLPEAVKFADWVTGEVLPSVRAHGAYMTKEKVFEMLTSPDAMIKLAMEMKALHEKVALQNAKIADRDESIKVLAPKADYADKVMDSGTLMTTTIIAKEMGVGVVTLNRFLKSQGVQYRLSGGWVLYRQHENKGLTGIVTHIITRESGPDTTKQMKWTEKGKKFIMDLWNQKQEQKKEEKVNGTD